MILVDTSIWVEALRKAGRQEIRQTLSQLLEESRIVTCPVVRLEILGAARKLEREALDSYFAEIPSIKISDSIWHEAISISRRLRDKGHTVPYNDILIASLALIYNIQVFSCDRHFVDISKVTRLKLWKG